MSRYMRLKFPYCQICRKRNSKVVHHIIRKSKGDSMKFLENNLVPICSSCHYKIHYVWDCFENTDIMERLIGKNEYYKLKYTSDHKKKWSKYELIDMIQYYRKQVKELE